MLWASSRKTISPLQLLLPATVSRSSAVLFESTRACAIQDKIKLINWLTNPNTGPISVTVHATDDQDRYTFLSELHALYTSDHLFLQHVDVHLVLDKFERQLNLWRNVARFYARTDFVMMLDVDFALCTDFRSRVRSNAEIMGRLYQGNVALVIPAFEHSKQIAGTDADQFPKDKDVSKVFCS